MTTTENAITYHNALCCMHEHCFQFLLENNENNAYANFGVTNKEHYGMLWHFLWCQLQKDTKKCGKKWRGCLKGLLKGNYKAYVNKASSMTIFKDCINTFTAMDTKYY